MAGRVLDRKRGAGRPPGLRADLFSGLHSGTGALQQKDYIYETADPLRLLPLENSR